MLLSAIILSGCAATGDFASWQCDANGLVEYRYDGSGTAYIHMQGHWGENYSVDLNEQKNKAIGTAANGTTFICNKSK